MKFVTFRELFEHGKQDQKLRIVTVNNRVFTGRYESRTDAMDNDPEVDTIELELDSGRVVTFPESDIKKIELID
ncbi:hypothetical protein [Weissella viridescens]|uniref:hypothetical protein n=1 Tax=Weissella viridescens TaxID=1629 RepID=UPI003528C2C5